jgi:hypothetical protein
VALEWSAKLLLNDHLDQQLNTSPASVLTDAHWTLFLSTEMDRVEEINAAGDAQSHFFVRIGALREPQPLGSFTYICGQRCCT